MPVAEDKRRSRELIANCGGWLLLALLVSRPLAAQSLGSELILSRLGDPVEVEIALKDWQQLDLKRIEVANATHAQYEAFKLTYLPLLDSLNFNVIGPTQAGEVKILVSSRKAVAEPYLDLLLVMKWPGGSALREYVLLFDPPLPNFSGAGEQNQRSKPSANPQPAATAPKPVAAVPAPEPVAKTPPPPAKPVDSDKPAVTPQPPAPPPAKPVDGGKAETKPKAIPVTKAVTKPEPPDVRTQTAIEVEKIAVTDPQPVVEKTIEPAPPPADDGRRLYRVRNGDSLWIIARQFQPAGIGENLYQFLISVYDLNHDAFINGNISMLKADAPLHIPSARDIAAINPATAQKIFEQQWREGVRKHELPADSAGAQFKPLNEAAEPKPPATIVAAPPLPPGTEKPDTPPPSSSPLLPASTAVVPAVKPQDPPPQPAPTATVAPAEPAPVPAIQVVPQQQQVTKSAPAALTSNPYLQKINESATAIHGMLELRQQRLQALEQQILAMQTEMQQAQRRSDDFNQGLGASLEQRRAEVTRKAILLGGLVALLLILLGVTIRYALLWNREIRAQQ